MADPKRKVTQACVERAHEALLERAASVRPTTRQKRDAAECLAVPVQAVTAPAVVVAQRTHAFPVVVALSLVVIAILAVVVAGCTPARAIEQARREAAICHGHAVDDSMSIDARVIGASEARAWQEQHRALTGDLVPGSEAWTAIPPEVLALVPPPSMDPAGQ
jgi:hypothetical protein